MRLYDRLFTVSEPDASGDFKSFINPNSLEVVTAKCEPALANARPEERYQFERLGYFALEPDSTPQKQVWEPYGDVERYLDERGETIVMRLAGEAPVLQREYGPNVRLSIVGQAHRLPGARTSKALGRFAQAPSLSRELLADDTSSGRRHCLSYEDVWGDGFRRL